MEEDEDELLLGIYENKNVYFYDSASDKYIIYNNQKIILPKWATDEANLENGFKLKHAIKLLEYKTRLTIIIPEKKI